MSAPIDPATIDDEAMYAITVVAPGKYRHTRFVPGGNYRVLGRVLRQILDLISDARRVDG